MINLQIKTNNMAAPLLRNFLPSRINRFYLKKKNLRRYLRFSLCSKNNHANVSNRTFSSNKEKSANSDERPETHFGFQSVFEEEKEKKGEFGISET